MGNDKLNEIKVDTLMFNKKIEAMPLFFLLRIMLDKLYYNSEK